MAIYDLFSKRQKRLRGDVPDVYRYDVIPKKLRVQIVQIIRDAFGPGDGCWHDAPQQVAGIWAFIHKLLCKEYGVFQLVAHARDDAGAVLEYFLKSENHEEALDIVEVCFRAIDKVIRKPDYYDPVAPAITPDDAIAELNGRFKEHGVGYQYESDYLIRVDSQFLHSEAVKPTLALLGSEERFKGASEEFLKAHEHYRNKEYKDCLVDALKSFESVMKAVCDKQRWAYDAGDTAKKLIDVCLSNGLVPSYLQNQFTSLKSLLESGVPTVRNKLGGHGQGTESIQVPESVAMYALHLTASNIVFLTTAEKETFG